MFTLFDALLIENGASIPSLYNFMDKMTTRSTKFLGIAYGVRQFLGNSLSAS